MEQEKLAELGAYYRAGRVMLRAFEPDDALRCDAAEWCAGGVYPERENLKALECHLNDALKAFFEAHPFASIAQPQEAIPELQALMIPRKAESLMAAAVYRQGALWGFAAVADAREHTRDPQPLLRFAETAGNE